ncbi:MAG TPA: YciI family protein [Puia sp.]|nr:YciI family protein [Puia sp.]
MEKFLLIIREDLRKLRQWSEEERYDGIREMDKWVKSLVQKKQYIDGDALHIKGCYVTRDHVLSDGPFIEAKEGISGTMTIEARDLNDAVSIAQSCPLVQSGNMAIEVRPLMGVKDIREIGDEPRTTGN